MKTCCVFRTQQKQINKRTIHKWFVNAAGRILINKKKKDSTTIFKEFVSNMVFIIIIQFD